MTGCGYDASDAQQALRADASRRLNGPAAAADLRCARDKIKGSDSLITPGFMKEPMTSKPSCFRCAQVARATRGRGGMQGSRQTVLLARRASTIKRWSLDARSKEQSACSLWESWEIRKALTHPPTPYEDEDDLCPCPSSSADRWPQSAGRDMSPFRKGCYADTPKHCWAAP